MGYEFKVGDKVKVLRKAKTNELGWGDSWEREMDEAVGNIGTVKSISEGLKYNVTVSGPKVPHFNYPSFVLELVTEKSINDFKVGQKVEVNYKPNSMWNGTGIVNSIYPHGHVSVKVNGMLGAFKPEKLTILEEPKPAAEPARKFKVGDRVRVTAQRGGPYALKPATITGGYQGFANYIYQINIEGYGGTPGFYPDNLELLPEPARFTTKPTSLGAPYDLKSESMAKEQGIVQAVKGHTEVFIVARKLAVQLAKANRAVNADQVQGRLTELGYTSTDLGNAAGALFRGKNWKYVRTQKSARKGNHLRDIKVWEYVGA